MRARPPRPIACASLALALLVAPSGVQAQTTSYRRAFAEHLLAFRALLAGSYGDEGPRVVGELEQLSGVLSAWDDSVRSDTDRLTAQLTNAAPGTQVALRIALASTMANRGRLADALRQVDAALAIDPARSALHMMRGRLLDAQGREADAGTAYRRAWELDHTDVFAAYFASGAFAPGGAPDPSVLESIIDAERQHPPERRGSNPPVTDLSLIPDSASATPLLAPAPYADGFALIAAGSYREALARFRAAIGRDPLVADSVSRTTSMATGLSNLRSGRVREAIAPLTAAAAQHSDSSEAHRILAAAYRAIGNDAEAIQHLRRAVQLAPTDERCRLALGRALRDTGQLDESGQVLRDARAALPQSAEVRWSLGEVLEKSGRDDEAAREFEAAGASTVVAGKGPLLWHVAELYDLQQQFDHVVALLRTRVRVDPNNATAHKNLGLVLKRLGQREAAFVELAMTDVLGGADTETLTALGELHLGAGRLEDAESVLRRAVSLDDAYQPARYALGRTLLRQGRRDEGREQLRVFEQIRAQAMENQRRTFEVDKLRAEVAQQVAAGQVDRVATTWGKIVEVMPTSAEFRVGLADALTAVGRFEEAAGHLERAAALGGGPIVQLRLSDVYAKLGRREASETARRLYDQQVRDLLKTPATTRP